MSLVNNTSTTSKRSIWPIETHDLWVVGAESSRLRLSNDLWYDDWASALGANTLGYRAIERPFVPSTSLPWIAEHDYAYAFTRALDVEAVRFFKTGSDALSCAVRLARAFTGRDYVAVFDHAYHGTGDWFGPALQNSKGTVDSQYLREFVVGKPMKPRYMASTLAAIVVEPVHRAIELPPLGWLQYIREVCNEHGIILISDEVILGFRHTLQGYARSHGCPADLYAYGKAMGQGAAISACCGRADIMDALKHDVHFSGTNNGEETALNVATVTLERYLSDDICAQLTYKGSMLRALLHVHNFETRGLDTRFEVVLPDALAASSYCFERGVLFPGWCSMAVSHTASQMDRLVNTLTKWRSAQ